MRVRDLISALSNVDGDLDVVVDFTITVQDKHFVAQRVELAITSVKADKGKAKLVWGGA